MEYIEQDNALYRVKGRNEDGTPILEWVFKHSEKGNFHSSRQTATLLSRRSKSKFIHLKTSNK